MEIFGAGEVLADQLRADHLAVLLDQAAVRLMRKEQLRDARHRQRIGDAGDQRHDDDHQDGGTNAVSCHCDASLDEADGGDDHVDQLDADERHDDAAEAVDQQIAAQQRRGADGRYATPRSASGISAMMISALKMIADRIALCGDAGA